MSTAFDYEKLKLFYIGKEKINDSYTPLVYKNKDLLTHAAIIGMTGSGKTGLGISLLEEAAIDNIPSIIIDPKGVNKGFTTGLKSDVVAFTTSTSS